MRYFVTKHAKQRRPNYNVTPTSEIIEVMKMLDKVHNFKDLKSDKYKIRYKGFCAVIKKEETKIVVITIREYNKIEEFYDKTKLKRTVDQYYVYRWNFKNRFVKCGKIKELYGTKNKILKLTPSLKKKYNIKFNRRGELFKDYADVSHLIHFNNEKNCYMLNKFKRIDYEKNKNHLSMM